MTDTIHSINYIVSTPSVLSGQPRLANRRVAVIHIASASQGGWGAERIASELNLSLAEVHAALSYYHDHKDEVERLADAAEAEARKHFYGSREEYLKQKGRSE